MLPLKKAERILGVLGLSFMGERPFDEDELSLYGSIAELLSSAFANARARETEVDARMKQAALRRGAGWPATSTTRSRRRCSPPL